MSQGNDSASKSSAHWFIHISPSYWTIFRSFDIILEMGTVH